METEKLITPAIVCDTCGSQLFIGEGLILWNEEFEVKFICKGKESCDIFPTYTYSDMIEHYFYKLCYNAHFGIIKRIKHKKW